MTTNTLIPLPPISLTPTDFEPTITPTIEITPIPAPTATPSALLDLKWNMMTVKSPVSFFNSYRLYYPTTWTIKEYKNTSKANDEGFSSLVLTKGKTTLSIIQGAGGAGTCLYPEDPEMEGMMSRFGPYIDILKSPLIMWRWAMRLDDESIPSYSVCEKKIEGNFVSSTIIGDISFSGNDVDADTKDETNYILEKIVIL